MKCAIGLIHGSQIGIIVLCQELLGGSDYIWNRWGNFWCMLISIVITEVKWKSLSPVRLFATSWTIQSMRNSPGQNTGVGVRSLLHDLPNPGIELRSLHCRQILYQLSHKGIPKILEWVAYPFSSGPSQPRDWTGVSCIAGRFFTS